MFTIVLAALLAVLGAAAVLAYVRQANNRAVAGLKAEIVVTANANISAGTSLAEAQRLNLLTTAKFPEASLPADPLRSVTAGNRNLVLTGLVGKGEVLAQSMLNTAANVVANGGFIIPAGMEAVTIQVCPAQNVAGYVTPGSMVSVFDTYALPTSKKFSSVNVQQTCDVSHQTVIPYDSWATRIVLTKAQVIAVGQSPGSQGTSSGIASTVANGSGAQSNGGVLVTLAVNQADAERLILLDEVGLPWMALLSNSSKPTYDGNTPTPLFRQP